MSWRDFVNVKCAQSIAFGGGAPVGGKIGDPYDLPRQSPIKTMGQLGDALREGTRQIGGIIGNKLGYDPNTSANVAELSSLVVPVYGTARSVGDIASALNRGDRASAAWGVASTPALVRAALPHAFHAGYGAYVAAPKLYRAGRKGLGFLKRYVESHLPDISPKMRTGLLELAR